ncbi:MAG: alanine--tRNA ligase [Alphaproteobacteria bacterium]|nr:MAG: alanine--tRNA ligase [Alphaproteobacteria bacterium]
MKNMNLSEIRNTFIQYFKKNSHKEIKSSNLVPDNDPTLLFTNSGMVQFKNIFTGVEKREYDKAVTSQKCLRAGGKHNDLENVGHTARHHTFFEMLGNFSFGDYFKEQAIHQSWDLLTKVFQIPKNKLLVTIFHEDEEAERLWKKIGNLDESKIIKIKTSDNFWSMGDTGPCGPCSEIFFDHGESVKGGPPGSKDEDGDRFIEIWNLVFMQFEQIDAKTRVNLPKPSIDTGMGLERISALLQGTHDNYETDLFKNLIKASSEVTKSKVTINNAASHRVIADHIRSSVFLISEGVLPSNDGRGYVLRRILRRAIRHSNILGYQKPFMNELSDYLVDEMGSAYPELYENKDFVKNIILNEELKFRETLDRGLEILNSEILQKNNKKIFSGKKAFELYDTYGFPLDLTQDVLKGHGWKVDEENFEIEMKKQKSRARAAWTGSGDNEISSEIMKTLNDYSSTKFIGYDNLKCEGKCLSIIKNNKISNSLKESEKGDLIFDTTVFYAESGGQKGDVGYINSNKAKIKVLDCKKINVADKIMFLHKVKVIKGCINTDDVFNLEVDTENRKEISSHHTSTHLLHEALREEFGTNVKQKGSLVSNEKLRFDFNLNHPIQSNILKKIEDVVNQKIYQNDKVNTEIMDQKSAMEKGAIALFGEKYGDEVRVVSMGKSITKKRIAWSVELCGGTHLKSVGEAIRFKIIGESGVASGVRRIEAVTRKSAMLYYEDKNEIIKTITSKLNINSSNIIKKIDQLIEENTKLKKIKKEVKSDENDFLVNSEMINGFKFFSVVSEELQPKELRSYAEKMLKKNKLDVVCIVSTINEKVSCVVNIRKEITNKLNAVELVNLISTKVDGKPGGGRPDMAQSGGQNVKGVQNAINLLKKYLINK